MAISALILIAAFAAGMSCGTAYADSFETVFPDDNYVQFDSPLFIGANSDTTAVYDEGSKRVFVIKDGAVSWYPVSSELAASGLYLFSNRILVTFGKQSADETSSLHEHYLIDLSADSPSFELTDAFGGEFDFASDGDRLYAKTRDISSNKIFVYGDSLDKPEYELSHGLFFDEKIFTGSGDKIFIYDVKNSDPRYNILSLTDASLVSYFVDFIPKKIAVGSRPFIMDAKGALSALAPDGDIAYDCQMSVRDFAVHGDDVFVITNEGKVEKYTSRDNTLTFDYFISMSGSDEKHLDTPNDVLYSDGKLFIADTLNDRVTVKTAEGQHSYSVPSPSHIAFAGGTLYAASGSKLFRQVRGTDVMTETLSLDFEIRDMAALDGDIYILGSGGVYICIANDAVPLIEDDGISRIAAADGGRLLYAQKDGTIDIYGASMEKISSVAVANANDAADMKADHAGDIFLLFDDRIEQYDSDLIQAALAETYELSSDYLNFTPLALALGDDRIYFVNKESFVGGLDASVTGKEDIIPLPLPELTDEYSFVSVTSDAAFCIDTDGRIESAQHLNRGVYLSRAASEDGAYRYIMMQEKLVIVPSAFLEEVSPTADDRRYIAVQDTALFSIPYSDGGVPLASGSIVVALDDAAGLDGGRWMRVSYEENIYFAERSALADYIESIPEEERVYGRIKADRVGGTVEIYAAPDASSEVCDKLVDGTKVEVLETLDGYYLVSYDGKTGYIKADKLQLDGLTTVQIIAIVLSVVVVLAGCVVFAAVFHSKKNMEKK